MVRLVRLIDALAFNVHRCISNQNMTGVLFGLLCLWCMSVGKTERSVDANVVRRLFDWIDGQCEQDDNVTFKEYDQAWTSCDTNNDSYISKEEVRAAVEQLQVGNNSYAEDIFGNQNFSIEDTLEFQFNRIDNSSDGFVLLSEFLFYYNQYLSLLDALDRLKEAIRIATTPSFS